jgi:hypothetical protein
VVGQSFSNSKGGAIRRFLMAWWGHVWSHVDVGLAHALAFAYTVPAMILIGVFYRPGVRDFFLLALIVFVSMWIAVTIAGLTYDTHIFRPAKRRQEEEEAARRAMAKAMRESVEREAEAARKAEYERRQRAEKASRILAEHKNRVRQEEAQFFQAFAAYRAQVDFHGTMDPAELRRGFAENIARFNLPLSGLYCDSLSPEVRAIVDMALESSHPPKIFRTLKKRRSDGSPILAFFGNEEDAEAFANSDAEEQWKIVATFTPRILDPWPVRIKQGF